ncbi:dihydrodipicolinate reductase C-terminal domain-containing protein [Terriglobus sp. YAF25]|uniref:dihydrodipicolinate reductase C-terminal domain-containing protein n=1 Tax=Terriglobus sp. YAF25 TaxID=3233080 RepID=UPI003F9562B4
MRILVLGHGKTGKLVADVAHERGHGVHVLDAKENPNAAALTPPFVIGFDVVIDFTTPEAVIPNLRACLATGARVVVGTTGWYEKLADMRGLAERKEAGLLYGTNFSIGTQVMFQAAAVLAKGLHEAFSRRAFADGAVRAAEWLSTRKGCYDFKDIFSEL